MIQIFIKVIYCFLTNLPLLSRKFTQIIIIFFLKTILPMNFTYYFIKNDFKSYHTSLHSFQFIQEFATKTLIIETTSNNIITTDCHYYFLSFFQWPHTIGKILIPSVFQFTYLDLPPIQSFRSKVITVPIDPRPSLLFFPNRRKKKKSNETQVQN